MKFLRSLLHLTLAVSASCGDIDSTLKIETSGPSSSTTPPLTTDPSDEFQRSVSNLPACPMPEAPVQHSDGVCDRVAQNDPSRRVARNLHHKTISGHDAVNRIADERTWICPDDDTAFDSDEEKEFIIGHEARWIVKNSSSGPVVLAWLEKKTRREVSPFSSKSYPAYADPEAILQPGQWKTVMGWQGHIFHARELKIIDGQFAPGRLLLRHRPGLIAIRNRLAEPLVCPAWAMADPNPHQKNSQRPPVNNNLACNALHKGFVNRVGCPVDLYFAGCASTDIPPKGISYAQGGGSDKNISGNTMGPAASCHEKFKMHLGLNPAPRDYPHDWDSPVKLEETYLTHKFVARLRHDPNVIVDEIVIREDVVGDCPDPKESTVKARTGPVGVAVLNGVDVSLGGGDVLAVPYVCMNATRDGGATCQDSTGGYTPVAPVLTKIVASN